MGSIGTISAAMSGGYVNPLLGSEDIELVRIQNEPLLGADMNRIPEVARIVAADLVDIDHAGVALGLVADQPFAVVAAEVDAQNESVAQLDVAVDQRRGRMTLEQVAVAETELRGRVLLRNCAAETASD
jgi:hypothetical protein